MKIVLLFCLSFLFLGSTNAQEWRDSVQAARNLYKQGEYEKAIKKYNAAQKIAPENIDLSVETAQSAMKLRDFKTAEKFYKESIYNEKDAYQKSLKTRNLGNSQLAQKKYDEAIETYKDALRMNPKDEKSRYSMSEAIRRKKKDEQEQQKNKDQNQNKDQDQDQQNKKDQKDQQDQQQKNQNGQNSQKNKEGDKSEEGDQDPSQGGGKDSDNKSKLSNKKVDKMLDDLMKQESFTRQKGRGEMGEKNTTKSGKDW